MAQVIVYRNLNRGGWSVAQVRGRVGVGRVIDHRASITLANVRFHVQPAAQAKVAAGAARTVHAWAIGELATPADPALRSCEITYNPRRSPHFTTRSGQPLAAGAVCAWVDFAEDGRAYLVNL